jgi:hypothetical protein
MLHEAATPISDHQNAISDDGRSASEARMTTVIVALITSCTGSAPKPAVITLRNASIREIIIPKSKSATLGMDSLVLVMDSRIHSSKSALVSEAMISWSVVKGSHFLSEKRFRPYRRQLGSYHTVNPINKSNFAHLWWNSLHVPKKLFIFAK